MSQFGMMNSHHNLRLGDTMQLITSQLRTLLKTADELQDLVYDYKELERKKKEAINADFFVQKSIAEYRFFKGLEVKSFIVFQVIAALFTSIVFFSLFNVFDGQVLALFSALLLGVGINVWFVLVYKPYKVEEWYLTGLIFYGLLLAGFGVFLLAYLSVVFFLDTGTFLLMFVTLINIKLFVSLVFGAIFPVTFIILDKRAIHHPDLKAALDAVEKNKLQQLEAVEDDLKSFEQKIIKKEEALAALTVVPNNYKGTKTLKILIRYFEDGRVKTIEEALALYDLEEQDALRKMTMLKVK